MNRLVILSLALTAVALSGVVAGCDTGTPSGAPVSGGTPIEPSATAAATGPRGAVGRADEMIVTTILSDGRPGTLLVELVSPGGRRRTLARLPAFGRLPGDTHEPSIGVDPVASDRGFLAVLTDSLGDASEPATVLIVDLLDPAAPPLRIPAPEGGLAWGPGGQLTVTSAGDVDLVDAATGTIRHVAVPKGVDVYPWPTADGRGWYAGRRAPGTPATNGPTGVLGIDSVFREGPLPPLYDATAASRPFGPIGERVDATTDAGGRRVFTVAPDGTTGDWYRFPDPRDGREFGNGEVRWTADGTALWVLDQVPGAYRLVRIDSPGASPTVVAQWLYQGKPGLGSPPIGFAGITADDSTIVFQRFDGADPPLVRIDTTTGTVEEIVEPPGGRGGTAFAGWAAVGDR